MPDSFLAFDEANSYLDKQQRSLDYLNRIQKLSVVTKTSVDFKSTNGYNRALYINKLNHLEKLPTTSIALTEPAIRENVGKSLSASEFKSLADELNNDDDSMQVSVDSQIGILTVEPQAPAEAMRKLLRQFLEQGHPLSGAWSVPVFPSEDVKFTNISNINESNGATNAQDDGLYEQVKKATNDPEYERKLDARIEEAYINKMRSVNGEKYLDFDSLFKSEDFTLYPDNTDDTNRKRELADNLIRKFIGQSNTAKFVNTKEEKDE